MKHICTSVYETVSLSSVCLFVYIFETEFPLSQRLDVLPACMFVCLVHKRTERAQDHLELELQML